MATSWTVPTVPPLLVEFGLKKRPACSDEGRLLPVEVQYPSGPCHARLSEERLNATAPPQPVAK